MTTNTTKDIDLSKPSGVSPIREILALYGVGRTVEGKPGQFPIFIAQAILRALGTKRGDRSTINVAYIDLETDYSDDSDSVSPAEEWYDFAQSSPLIVDAAEYAVNRGTYQGTQVVHLIFKGTGMSVPFYLPLA